MTRKRYDSHSTEFGLWLREQIPIESRRGYVATNIDYMWQNYKTGKFFLLEEKRYMAELTFAQEKMFKDLHYSIQSHKYYGFFLLQFQETSPDNGDMFLNGVKVTKDILLEFLTFNEAYISLIPPFFPERSS